MLHELALKSAELELGQDLHRRRCYGLIAELLTPWAHDDKHVIAESERVKAVRWFYSRVARTRCNGEAARLLRARSDQLDARRVD